jgi:NACHT domain
VEITAQFFKYPGRAKVVGTVARLLASWLRTAGLGTAEADAAVLSLPGRFVARLNNELTENSERYQKLIKEHAPPFATAAEAEAAWLGYHIELHTLANPLVLNLGVSLEAVYVELRAYTVAQVDGTDAATAEHPEHWSHQVCNVGTITEMTEKWMEDRNDAIFVLSGGPGAGKSAFARRFAAWQAWSGPDPWRVLFVPLHRFKLGTELKPSLSDFASGELKHDLTLFDRNSDDRLLIIFDGLDELAQQGKVGEEAAADFFRRNRSADLSRRSCAGVVFVC